VEPAGERRQVHAGARAHLGRRTQARRTPGNQRARRRRRHRAGVPAADLHALPPGRQQQCAPARWPRPGAGHRQAARRAARRLGAGLEPRRRLRLDVHGHPAVACIDGHAGRRFERTWRRLDPDRMFAIRVEGLRVLAVEDQADMLESLRQMLEDHGATVTAVTSGAAAYALLRTSPANSMRSSATSACRRWTATTSSAGCGRNSVSDRTVCPPSPLLPMPATRIASAPCMRDSRHT